MSTHCHYLHDTDKIHEISLDVFEELAQCLDLIHFWILIRLFLGYGIKNQMSEFRSKMMEHI